MIAACLIAVTGFLQGPHEEDFKDVDKAHITNLGPTGARGDIKGKTFVVSYVFKGSPAEGRLQIGDVITGANGNAFGDDPRHGLGQAIEESEGPLKGKLVLDVTRANKNIKVEIPLRPLGSFAPTWPNTCKKSDRILREAAEFIAAGQKGDGHWEGGYGSNIETSAVCGLVLLACADPRYESGLHKTADWLSKSVEIVKIPGPGAAPALDNWPLAFASIFLAEYYLATKDEKVLPSLKKYHDAMIRNQITWPPNEGAWGHGAMDPKHGGGYEVLNIGGSQVLLALALIRECGLKINLKAVEKGQDYMDLGAKNDGGVGYNKDFGGMPAITGACAIAYHLLGNRPRMEEKFGGWLGKHYSTFPSNHAEVQIAWMWGFLGLASTNAAGHREALDHWKGWLNCERMWDGTFAPQRKVDAGVDWHMGRYWTTACKALIFAVGTHKLRVGGGKAPQPKKEEKTPTGDGGVKPSVGTEGPYLPPEPEPEKKPGGGDK